MFPLIINDDKIRWTFNCQVQNLYTNCGAKVLAAVTIHKQDTSQPLNYGTHPYLQVTQKDSFAFLTKFKKEILKEFLYGFYILSDTVGYGKDFFDPGYVTPMCTSRFAAWIALNKVGAIFRGPVTNNPNYTKRDPSTQKLNNPDGSGHCIVPWIWVPDITCLKNADCEWYIDPEWRGFTEPQTFNKKRLPKTARSYVNRERGLARGKLGLDGKKIKAA